MDLKIRWGHNYITDSYKEEIKWEKYLVNYLGKLLKVEG